MIEYSNKENSYNKTNSSKTNSNSQKIKSKISNFQYPQSQGNQTCFQKIDIKLPLPNSEVNFIKTYCRIRPNNSQENCIKNFTISGKNDINLIVDYFDSLKENKKYEYKFTKIFSDKVKNKEIFINICEPIIKDLFTYKRSGIIFVYGVTNSGKTYTVNGDTENPGILPSSLNLIYQSVKNFKRKKLEISCTYVEIYNEEIFDLFSLEKNKVKLCGSSHNFFLKNATVKKITNLNDLNEALTLGINHRTINSTNLNNNSSRAHSIFRVEINFGENEEKCSFSIADLAGVERANRAGTKGENLKETGQINNSLLILRKCFDAMEQNSNIIQVEKKIRVPIRESKLTMLMKEYLNGNKNVIMICTINPNLNDMFDNKNVLHFASKAQKVKPIKSWIEQIKKVNSKVNKGLISKKIYRMYTTSKEHKRKKFNKKNKNNNKIGSKIENKDFNINGNNLNNSVFDSSSDFSESESDSEIFSSEKNNLVSQNFKKDNNIFKKVVLNDNNNDNNVDKENEDINLLQKQKIIEYIKNREEYLKFINTYENNYAIYKNICLELKNVDLRLPFKSKPYIVINPFYKDFKEDKQKKYKSIKESELEIKGKEKIKIFKKIKNYFTIESIKNTNKNSICSEGEFEVISFIKKSKNNSNRKTKKRNKLSEKKAFTDISDFNNSDENYFESIPEKEEEHFEETGKKISNIFKNKIFENEGKEKEMEKEKEKEENNKKKTKKRNNKKTKKKYTISDNENEEENENNFSKSEDNNTELRNKKKCKSKKSKYTNDSSEKEESSSDKKDSESEDEEKKDKKTKKKKGKSKKRQKNKNVD